MRTIVGSSLVQPNLDLSRSTSRFERDILCERCILMPELYVLLDRCVHYTCDAAHVDDAIVDLCLGASIVRWMQYTLP
jgi:hypothetical protein